MSYALIRFDQDYFALSSILGSSLICLQFTRNGEAWAMCEFKYCIVVELIPHYLQD